MLSAGTLAALMSRRSYVPPDAPADVMRAALQREKFLGGEDGPQADDTPRDTVTEMVLNKTTTQLVSWDQEGKVGPLLTMATESIRDSHADWLLEQCREIYRAKHPERALHII